MSRGTGIKSCAHSRGQGIAVNNNERGKSILISLVRVKELSFPLELKFMRYLQAIRMEN